ncbi:sensor histidine kinase [Paenibacillus psychroresistens]|uniref:Sensor histidine kinase n=1 Tax=Paenibacillus psychroresistens TaxID=1778678 RepID=A0A6B8RK29_9BACL|nr:sensor histidine kinase [Paenibacillus psychroresistens]QGQ95945.1 sensor histidine kinase [Paenibacillus psychroresistens]
MKRIWAWIMAPIQYIKRSFYRKMLLAFFAIIIITVTSLGANFYFETSDSIKQNAISTMERTTEQAVQTLQLQMGNIKNDAWSFFGDEELQRLVKNFPENSDKLSYFDYKFSIMQNNNSLIEILLVNDKEGNERIQKITNKKYYEDRNLFASEKIKLSQIALKNNGKEAWVLTDIYDAQKKQTIQSIAYTQALKDVYAEQQPIVGNMIVILSFDKLQSWLSALRIQDHGEFFLVNKQDSRIILSTEASNIGEPLFEETNLIEWNKYHEDPYTFVKDQNQKSLVVYRSLLNTDWILVGKVPVNVLLEQVNAVAQKTILIGFVCLLAAMLLASLLSSRVLVPIRRLRKGMRQIEQGNYKIAVPVETNDEIGFFVAGFNKMTREIDRLIVKVYETELKKKDAEIKALQSQINPHFLYNTLGTIESLAAIQGDNKSIRDICHSLAQMMRYNVNGGSFSTLGEEIQQIKQYLMIQQIRYESRLTYDIWLEPELESMRIPKLLFQPIVENSIIHGIEGLRRGGQIWIKVVSLNEHDVVISVKDDGIGMNDEQLSVLQTNLNEVSMTDFSIDRQRSSIGVVNAHSRLKLIYGEAYGLTIESQLGSGTEVSIRLMKTVV